MPGKNVAPKIDLEKSLAKLEAVVEKLESGDQPLEKALKLFEEGISLTRGCQLALKQAEEKITILNQQNDDWLAESEEPVGDFLDGTS
ncbi:MAG: exodeoxyribonuclease VII small subunit [Gammaproteobacteria bacterium]